MLEIKYWVGFSAGTPETCRVIDDSKLAHQCECGGWMWVWRVVSLWMLALWYTGNLFRFPCLSPNVSWDRLQRPSKENLWRHGWPDNMHTGNKMNTAERRQFNRMCMSLVKYSNSLYINFLSRPHYSWAASTASWSLPQLILSLPICHESFNLSVTTE